MTQWYDHNDEPYGEWVACSENEYLAAYRGLTDPVVFSSRTRCGESRNPNGYGPPYEDRDIVTEWGQRDAAFPVCRCEDSWDSWGNRVHVHYLYLADLCAGERGSSPTGITG